MIKALVIRWVLPAVIDFLISALESLVDRTSNSIDDEMVETIKVNRNEIIDEIKAKL